MKPRQPFPEFLLADALVAAPRLLGWELVTGSGDTETGGRIVELEAYHGSIDPASHAYRGRTPRTAPMFEAAGVVYIYFSYGMHTCLNLVTGPEGEAQALLIRALEPTRGLDLMRQRRRLVAPTALTSGPGKLTQALGIGLELSGRRLGDQIKLYPPTAPLNQPVAAGPRIGISRAVAEPWRFYLDGNPYVSKVRPTRPKPV